MNETDEIDAMGKLSDDESSETSKSGDVERVPFRMNKYFGVTDMIR